MFMIGLPHYSMDGLMETSGNHVFFLKKKNFPPSVGLFPVDFHIIRFWEMHARNDIDDH